MCASVCECPAFFDSCFSFFFSLPLNLAALESLIFIGVAGHYRRNLPCRGCIPQEVWSCWTNLRTRRDSTASFIGMPAAAMTGYGCVKSCMFVHECIFGIFFIEMFFSGYARFDERSPHCSYKQPNSRSTAEDVSPSDIIIDGVLSSPTLTGIFTTIFTVFWPGTDAYHCCKFAWFRFRDVNVCLLYYPSQSRA